MKRFGFCLKTCKRLLHGVNSLSDAKSYDKYEKQNDNDLVSFIDYSDFFCLPITFANSLDPDQDRQYVGPDLDPNRLTL